MLFVNGDVDFVQGKHPLTTRQQGFGDQLGIRHLGLGILILNFDFGGHFCKRKNLTCVNGSFLQFWYNLTEILEAFGGLAIFSDKHILLGFVFAIKLVQIHIERHA